MVEEEEGADGVVVRGIDRGAGAENEEGPGKKMDQNQPQLYQCTPQYTYVYE